MQTIGVMIDAQCCRGYTIKTIGNLYGLNITASLPSILLTTIKRLSWRRHNHRLIPAIQSRDVLVLFQLRLTSPEIGLTHLFLCLVIFSCPKTSLIRMINTGFSCIYLCWCPLWSSFVTHSNSFYFSFIVINPQK